MTWHPIFTEALADDPWLAAAPDGRPWISWRRTAESADGAPGIVLARPLDAAGETVELHRTFNPIDCPRIVFDDQMRARLVWLAELAGVWHVCSGTDGGETEVVSGQGSVAAFAHTVDCGGRVWVAWQEAVDGDPAVKTRCLTSGVWGRVVHVSPEGVSCWRPAICASVSDGVWLAWDAAVDGAYDVFARHVSVSGELGDIHRITSSRELSMDCSIAESSAGSVWIAYTEIEHWNTTRTYRLNEHRELFLRRLDPATGRITVCDSAEERCGGRVDVPRGDWGGNVTCPSLFVDTHGAMHLIYRHIRISGDRTEKIYDWGWSLWDIVREGSAWQEPVRISQGTGFSMSLPCVLGAGDGLYVAGQESDHTAGRPDDRSPSSPPHIAVYRVAGLASAGSARAPHVWEVHEVPRFGLAAPAESAPGPRLLWGDLHRHSDMSRCVSVHDGSAWDHFRWARDVAGLDFYCITDHVDQMNDHEWCEHINFVQRFVAPGRFVPLIGFEGGSYGPGTMHVNVYCTDREAAISAREIVLQNPRDLARLSMCLMDAGMRGRVLVIPHFHGQTIDLSATSVLPDACRDVTPFIEVVQTRGFSPDFAHAVTRAGLTVAFTGSSDHASPPWARAWTVVPGWRFRHAITGLWADDVSTNGVFEALRCRRAFATNGVKLVVDLTANGAPTAASIECDTSPELRLTARGTTRLSAYEILRDDGQVVHSADCGEGGELDVTYSDDSLVPARYYYARVRQEPETGYGYFGEAWTSPVYCVPRQAQVRQSRSSPRS